MDLDGVRDEEDVFQKKETVHAKAQEHDRIGSTSNYPQLFWLEVGRESMRGWRVKGKGKMKKGDGAKCYHRGKEEVLLGKVRDSEACIGRIDMVTELKGHTREIFQWLKGRIESKMHGREKEE